MFLCIPKGKGCYFTGNLFGIFSDYIRMFNNISMFALGRVVVFYSRLPIDGSLSVFDEVVVGL